MSQNVLFVGAGGREHALAWACSKASAVGKIYVAPGNGGTVELGENVSIGVTEVDRLLDFAEKNNAIVVVGNEEALTNDIAGCGRERGIHVVGPTGRAAELEGNKKFMKELAVRMAIPTAPFKTFTDATKAFNYVTRHSLPIEPVVIKEIGLAGGKGAIGCFDAVQAATAIRELITHGMYSRKGVVIEDYLGDMPEVSIHVLVDEKGHIIVCPPMTDHKKNHEGKQTGGCGTICPTPWMTEHLMKQATFVATKILAEMRRLGRQFTGFLYPGFMLNKVGEQWILKLLEVNVRPGDSECQNLIMKLKTDFLSLMWAIIDGTLPELHVEWHPGHNVCLILYAEGYPGSAKYGKGQEITGIEIAEQKCPGVKVFHAGTEKKDGKFYTSGGRVVGVGASGETLQGALDMAYEAANYIDFKGKTLLKTVGTQAMDFKLSA